MATQYRYTLRHFFCFWEKDPATAEPGEIVLPTEVTQDNINILVAEKRIPSDLLDDQIAKGHVIRTELTDRELAMLVANSEEKDPREVHLANALLSGNTPDALAAVQEIGREESPSKKGKKSGGSK